MLCEEAKQSRLCFLGQLLLQRDCFKGLTQSVAGGFQGLTGSVCKRRAPTHAVTS